MEGKKSWASVQMGLPSEFRGLHENAAGLASSALGPSRPDGLLIDNARNATATRPSSRKRRARASEGARAGRRTAIDIGPKELVRDRLTRVLSRTKSPAPSALTRGRAPSNPLRTNLASAALGQARRARHCLMTQTRTSGLTSACSRTGTRYTPSDLIGSWSSICRFST